MLPGRCRICPEALISCIKNCTCSSGAVSWRCTRRMSSTGSGTWPSARNGASPRAPAAAHPAARRHRRPRSVREPTWTSVTRTLLELPGPQRVDDAQAIQDPESGVRRDGNQGQRDGQHDDEILQPKDVDDLMPGVTHPGIEVEGQ